MYLKYLVLPLALVVILVAALFSRDLRDMFLPEGVQFLYSEAAAGNGATAGAARGSHEKPAAAMRPRRGGNRSKPETVQVMVAPAQQSAVQVFLSGLGTVTAYNKVDIKAQVDGIITELHFDEGDDVAAGTPLATIDPTPYRARVERWKAAKQRAEAQLANAKGNLSRAQQLRAKSYVTEKQIDEQATLVSQYAADVAAAESQIKIAQTQLDHTIVRSPIDGRTGIRNVDPGNLIRAANNTNIVTVVQLQPISVIISLPARDLARAGVTPGMSDLPVFAYAQNGTTLLDVGQLQTVDNEVDPKAGTIQLKATFPNKEYRLWPGDFVNCKVVVEERQDGITVPSAAIRHGPKADFVWVVGPDNTAETRRVKVRQTTGETTLLDQGLKVGERVVVRGQYHLEPGSHVEIVSEQTGGSELTRR
jgi:multidrug efflux system membrane fusion protein